MSKILNLASYYILPLVELSRNSFGDKESTKSENSNFIDSYLGTDDEIIVEVRNKEEIPDSSFNAHYFTDIPSNRDTHLLIYKVAANHLKDIKLFRQGKYSRMSDAAKNRITIFSVTDERSELYKVLYRDKGLKRKLEEEIGTEIDDEAEVFNLPSPDNFVDLSTLITK